MSRGKILLIEDDARTQILLSQILEKEGYKTKSADSLWKAQGEMTRFAPDLIVLDRKLPDGDGLEYCRRLKSEEKTKNLPVLFLTSKDSVTDKVVGLKMGGEDYLTKPFQAEELLARIEVILRRLKNEDGPAARVLRAYGVVLDLEKHQCLVDDQAVKLWPKEFELLKIFLERPGRLLSKEFLSERVWGHEFFSSSRAIEIAVQRLRHKLGSKGRYIETVKGYGFRLQEEN
jgi:DNA-binding response OmpR family regulator